MRKKTINLDITNKCSNFCPGCMRQLVYDGKNIPGGDLSTSNMKKISLYFDEINFCGQGSDPIMHDNLFSLLECCVGKEVTIHTSATPKPKEYYVNLFELSSKNNFKWFFGLDGYPQKTNPYRINQDGILLFEIMKLGAVLGVEIIWSLIYFNFNEDEVDKCLKLAEKYNIKFITIRSSRWQGELEKFKPKNKNNYLESLY
jgi:hypothetical protein